MIPTLPVYAFTPNWGGFASMVVTVLLPILVAVVTRPSASGSVKAVLLLVLAVIKTFAETYIAAEAAHLPFHWVPVLMNILINFGVATAVYFGFWKPTGTAPAIAGTVGPKD